MDDLDDADSDDFIREVADFRGPPPPGPERAWRLVGLAPGEAIGRYQPKRLLGAGGMGAVFEAEGEGRRVAVKILRKELARDPELAARFRREALAASRVSHPNIVRVLDFDVDAGRAYLAMELLEGETFGALLRREGKLPIERARAIIDPVIAALAHAHERGVVHRDVKPDNVFLSKNGVKVLDFGLAKLDIPDQAVLTASGRSSLGTPSYMAPEQFVRAKAVDATADVYAVATMLYEALSGRLPHRARTYEAMVIAKATEPPKPLADVRSDLGRSLCDAIMRGLARDPRMRQGSMHELARDLEGTSGPSRS